MTTSKHAKSSQLLAGGGLCTINPCGHGFVVDVFAAEWEDGDDPIYHAFYSELLDARIDMASWVAWED
jgi:hypothetical protein